MKPTWPECRAHPHAWSHQLCGTAREGCFGSWRSFWCLEHGARLRRRAVGILQAPFEVLTVAQLQERQAEALQQTAAITMLPEDEASRVLRHFSWCAVRMSVSMLPALLVCAR